MSMITTAIVLAIVAITAAIVFVPGVATAVFTGLGKALFSVMAENRQARIERRREFGIFGLRRRRQKETQTPEKETSTILLDSPPDVSNTSSVVDDVNPKQHLRDRLKERRNRRRRRGRGEQE